MRQQDRRPDPVEQFGAGFAIDLPISDSSPMVSTWLA